MSTFSRSTVQETTTTTPGMKPAPTVVITEKKKSKGRGGMIQRLLLSLLGLGLVVGAYFYFKPSVTSSYTIRYAAVERGDITKAVTATGTVQATKTVQVGSQVSGTILKLYADFNSIVTRGQLLAQLDPTFYQTTISSAEANVAQAQAALSEATREEARATELLKRQLIAQAEYDIVHTKLLTSRATVQQVTADLQKARVNLSYTTISSPINGTVVSRNVDVGQTVAASLNAPVIFTIAEDLSKMQVSANVDEADISQVVEGQDVKFTIDAYPGQEFHGTVLQIRINPITAQNVVTYSVIISVDNGSGKLLPGMTATVGIISAAKQGVVKVPTSALRFTPPADLTGTVATTDQAKGGGRSGGGSGGAGTGKSHDHSKSGVTSDKATLYIKSKDPKQQITPVQVTTGLSDGATTEILLSDPALTPGDSIVIGAYSNSTSSTTPAAKQPGAAPLGGAGGGGRRF
jgi:HlyD family secretion protein